MALASGENVGGSRQASPLATVFTPRFAARVILSRWFVIFASCLIMAASGATYIFSIYSVELRSSLGYNQQTLNTISFFKDLGTNVGILSGLINEVTPPWVVLLIGAGMNLFGYLMIYLAITFHTAKPPVSLMCFYICVGANALAFSNTGALVTCVKNFPESRGNVIGLLKGFVGLSGAIYTQIYLAIYGDDAKSLVLLIAWLPAAISIVFVYTIRIMPYNRKPEGENNKPFFYFLYISVALATYLLVMIVVQQQVNFSHAAYSISATALLIILFLPLGVVINEEYKLVRQLEKSLQQPPAITVDDALTEELQPPPTLAVTSKPEGPSSCSSFCGSCFANIFRPPAMGDDYTILQALFSIDMLVLFFGSVCGIGGTLTAIDNMGQIGQSLGYPPKSINTFVSLISIWNYAGRVFSGFISEIFITKYKFPRPLMLTIILLVSCVGHLLIAFGVPNSLYAASVIIGLCFGAQWPLLFAIISEVFGLKYYSTLFNFGAVASPIGSYILNVRIAGHMYDVEAAKQNGGSNTGNSICLGVQCFKKSFLIITAVTVLGALVSLVLVWRTRSFYKGDIYARFKVAPTEPKKAVKNMEEEAAESKEKELISENKN